MAGASALRSTVLWLSLLIVAVVAIAWQMRNPSTPVADAEDTLGPVVVSTAYEDWLAIELLQRGERVRFERDASGQWFRHDTNAGATGEHSHRIDPAAAERIGSALATFSRARVERRLASEGAQMANYGLTNPALIALFLGRDARVLQTLELGEVAPDQLSRYVHVPQTRQVFTIADFQARGLLSLLAISSSGSAKPGP